MTWARMLWLRVTGRYEAERSAALGRHPAGKRVGR